MTFHRAGLPTEKRDQFEEEEEKETKAKVESVESKVETKDEEDAVEEVAVQLDGVIEVARAILVAQLKLPRKNWNKGGSRKQVFEVAKSKGLIPGDMSQTKFKKDVLEPNLDTVYE